MATLLGRAMTGAALAALTVCACLKTEPTNSLEGSIQALFSGVDRPILVRPDGSARWYAGNDYRIEWTSGTRHADSLVTLRLSVDDGKTFPHIIASDIPNTGLYTWTVPPLPSERSRIQNVGTDSANVSPAPFWILEKPVPVQVSFGGGEWRSWRNNRIAYMSRRNGHYDIYVASVLGRQETRITTHSADDRYPTFDSKAFHLAYVSTRTGQEEIWANTLFAPENPPGGSAPPEVQLTFQGGTQPSWRPLPNSDRLAFLYRQNDRIYLRTLSLSLPLRPSSHIQIHGPRGDGSIKENPVWVTDSRLGTFFERIFFKEFTPAGANAVAYRDIEEETADVEYLPLPFTAGVLDPTFSPAGGTLAVSIKGDIYVMNLVDGVLTGDPLQVTFGLANDNHPTLRSDHELAFQSDRSGQWEIYRIRIPQPCPGVSLSGTKARSVFRKSKS
ncbi:MAG: PD40 domain-containing protein [candidate division Zixibacteria bacterium]|nr:PD40 domain-containing protein [candidate division Zixibacteria bacterium]